MWAGCDLVLAALDGDRPTGAGLRVGGVRLDQAECDRVDVDLEAAPFLGHGLGHAEDAGLACRVIDLARIAAGAGDRRDVDDLAEVLDARLGFLLRRLADEAGGRSEEHTSELQSLMRNSYAVFCLKKKKKTKTNIKERI